MISNDDEMASEFSEGCFSNDGVTFVIRQIMRIFEATTTIKALFIKTISIDIDFRFV